MAEIRWTDDQRKALETEGSLLVSASAGSGKTTVMMERVLRYLTEGGDVSRLVVITFTKAAAAELKEKLTEKIAKALRQGTPHAGHLKEQLKKIPLAHIQTIDSFCSDIYRTYFEDIGRSPVFRVMEEGEGQAAFRRSLDETLAAYLAEEKAEFVQLATAFTERRTLDPLREAVTELHRNVSAMTDPDAFFDTAAEKGEDAAGYLLSDFRRQGARLERERERLLARTRHARLTKWESDLETLGEYTRVASALTTPAEAARQAAAILPIGAAPRLGNAEKTPEGLALHETLRRFRARVKAYIEGFTETFGLYSEERVARERNAVSVLIEVTRAARARYAQRKEEEGVVDFSDLEQFALKILSDPVRAAEVREGIDGIFLDEYQDTNPLQEAIVRCIGSGNVFMVGDVKQAIYGFRYADPDLFLARKEEFDRTDHGSNVPLNDNFRSDGRILRFVNAVFAEVMTSDFGGIDYRAEAMLKPELEYPVVNDLPAVEAVWFERSAEEEVGAAPPEIYSVSRAEPAEEAENPEGVFVAERIASIVGKVPIYDPVTKETRLARYGDIAVLMRNKDGKGFFSAFERRKIPYAAGDFRGEATYDDEELLVNFLRVLDNFDNDIPLVAVMNSPIGGFDATDLVRYRPGIKEETFACNVRRAAERGDEKAAAWLATVERYRKEAARKEVAEILSEILEESGLDGILIAAGNRRIEAVNVMIQSLRGKEYGRTVAAYLAYRKTEGGTPSVLQREGDVVRFYSIHKSKGLEFPVVFLCKAHLGCGRNGDGTKKVLVDRDFGIAVRLKDEDRAWSKSLTVHAFRRKAELRDKEELARLYYVAMTRARGHLFISGAKGRDEPVAIAEDGKSLVDWIDFAAELNPEVGLCMREGGLPAPLPASTEVAVRMPLGRPIALPEPYAYHAEGLANKYGVTALAKRTEDEAETPYIPSLDAQTTQEGTAYHRIMELIDFDATELGEIEAAINDAYRLGEIDASVRRPDAAVLQKALRHPLLQTPGVKRRELPFMMYLPAREVTDTACTDPILVQGVIDLLIEGEETVLVDYKFSGASEDALIKRYRKQMELYAKAVETGLGKRPDRKVLFVVNRALALEIP